MLRTRKLLTVALSAGALFCSLPAADGQAAPTVRVSLAPGEEQASVDGVQLFVAGTRGRSGVLSKLRSHLGTPTCAPTNAGPAPSYLDQATYFDVRWKDQPMLWFGFWGPFGHDCSNAQVVGGLTLLQGRILTSRGAIHVGSSWKRVRKGLRQRFQYDKVFDAFLLRFSTGPCADQVFMQVHVERARVTHVDVAAPGC